MKRSAPPARAGLWTTPIRGRVAGVALAWVLAYVAGVVALVVGAILLVRLADGPRPSPVVLAVVVFAGTAVAAVVAVRVHLVRRRGLSWADVGLRRPERSPLHLAWQIPAVMTGGALASAAVLLLLGLGEVSAGSEGVAYLATAGPVGIVLGLVIVALLVPLAEEVVFRGIVLPAVRARLPAATGIPLAGAVFAVVHFLPPALPYLLVVGISLCAMAQWYRSIVPGVVLHGVNNAVVFVGVLTAGG